MLLKVRLTSFVLFLHYDLVKLMRISVGKLKQLIVEISGSLRRVRGQGGQQHKIGKIEDENRELSFSEAEMLFPGSTNVWAEIVPSLFPDFPFDDPLVIKRKSNFFKIGDKLTAAFADQPQIELATWDPVKEDWIENEFASN